MKNYNDIFNNLPPEEQAKIKARYEELRKEYLESNPTILERLEQRERVFFEGDPNSSERATRKRVAAEAVEEKHHKRS